MMMSALSLHTSLVGGVGDVSLRGLASATMMAVLRRQGSCGCSCNCNCSCGTSAFKTETPKFVRQQKQYFKFRNTGRMLVTIEARICTPTKRKYPGTSHRISSARGGVKRVSRKVGGSGDGQEGDETAWLYLLFFSGDGGGGNGNGDGHGNNGDGGGGNNNDAQDDYWMRDLLALWFIFCAWSAWNVLQMALQLLSSLGGRDDNRVTGGLACSVSQSISMNHQSTWSITDRHVSCYEWMYFSCWLNCCISKSRSCSSVYYNMYY